jgi:protein gp37
MASPEPKQPELADILHHYPEITGIHPAADIFPMMQPDELLSLVANIKAQGLANDVVLTKDGLLIDGRNRVLGCYLAEQEIRFRRVDPTDPIGWAWSQNGERRNLNSGQKAWVGNRMRGLYEDEAKKRQGTRTDLKGNVVPFGGKDNFEALMPQSSEQKREPQARDKAGAAVGVGGRYLDMARDVERFAAPEVAKQVQDGSLSLTKAHADVRPLIKAAKEEKAAAEPAKERSQSPVVTPDGEVKLVPTPAKTTFNATNANVEWASWTWNPVTGCLHGCEFCYARAIVHNEQMAPNYPFAFEPAFYEHRLAAPVNTKRPASADEPGHEPDGRVFVGSMADLFGKWVPDAWIKAVFKACMAASEWEYLFLTKWPKRYSLLASLPHAWFGASVIQQSDVKRIESNMKSFSTSGVKWVSLEPMLEPIRFNDLSWCDLVVIGGQTGTRQPTGYVGAFAPNFDWVVDVVNQCREAGVPYYLKPNLMGTAPGMVLPKGTPRRVA